jgi:hypothetical protein
MSLKSLNPLKFRYSFCIKICVGGHRGDQTFFGVSKVFSCIEGSNMMAMMLDLC